jgi:hypothetical protein
LPSGSIERKGLVRRGARGCAAEQGGIGTLEIGDESATDDKLRDAGEG